MEYYPPHCIRVVKVSGNEIKAPGGDFNMGITSIEADDEDLAFGYHDNDVS